MSRNHVAHAYNQAVALDIVKQARAKYVDMFEQLKSAVMEQRL